MNHTVNKFLLQNLERALVDYINSPEDPELNYRVAIIYEQLEQWAAALSFFLRTAERTQDKDLTYECLIKIGLMFDRPKNRVNSVRGMYKAALLVLPTRPEAYFMLARHYEREKDYVSAYTWASLGEQFSDINAKPLRSWVEYPGKYGIKFEKAVASWWWGREKHCRVLFRELAEEYHLKMDDSHTDAVYNNIKNLGIGVRDATFLNYDSQLWEQLRLKFNGSESMTHNYAQMYQDLFVLSVLDGRENGKYLEIGSGHPKEGNNTALLEERFNWYGVAVESNGDMVSEYRNGRKNPVWYSDALNFDYSKIIRELNTNGVIDYLQIDCGDPITSYNVLQKIPFDLCKFAVITFAHDHYLDKTKQYRNMSRDLLTKFGYELMVTDVSPEGHSSMEDWYVHPELVSRNVILKMKDVSYLEKTTNNRTAKDYMFPVVKK